MAPEAFEQAQQKQLVALAKRIAEWQAEHKLSLTQLARQVPQIGSDKTFKKILNEDFSEMDVEKQLDEYNAAVVWIESREKEDTDEQQWYDDMTGAVKLRSAFNRMWSSNTPARCGWVIGPTGSGKTGARTALVRKFGSPIVTVEASVVWSDRPSAFLRAVAKAIGITNIPQYSNELKERVVESLKETRRCIVVEEGHHLGPHCLDTVKTIINETMSCFIIVAVDTLWRRLEMAAFEQARQLTGNRFAFRIVFSDSILARDCGILALRRGELADDVLRKGELAPDLAENLVENAKKYGRLAFVREFLKKLRKRCGDAKATREEWIASLSEEIEARRREEVRK